MTEPRVLWVLLALAIAYTGEALRLGVGGFAAPGPGLYPFAIGAAIATTCALRLVVLRVAPRVRSLPTEGDEGRPTHPWTVARLVAVLVGFALGQAVIGFIPALGLALLAALAITGYARWPQRVAVACVSAVVVHVVFQRLLGVPFPKGMLGALLG